MRADRKLLAGVFLVCFANLLFEVMITRLFSATMFYHFTFLAVALALFGVAASGFYVMSLAIAFIIAPLVIHRLRSRRLDQLPALALVAPDARLATLSYFGLVGLAFMTIEIALLQRFTLFLGHRRTRCS
jgi:hypothetical protein